MMKKITLICSILLTGLCAKAQSNLHLDTWSDVETADNWDAALNGFASFIGDTSVVQTQGFSGSGAKLKAVDLMSTLGFPFNGSFFNYGATGTGIPYTDKPTSVNYEVKQVGSGSTLLASFALTKYNAGTDAIDTVAQATTTTGEFASFELQNLNFVYDPANGSLTPDSLKISFTLITTDPNAPGNCFAVVDEINLVSGNASVESQVNYPGISMFPTVATTNVNFVFGNAPASAIQVTNMTGELVKSVKAEGTSLNMNVSDLEEGMYIYKVYDPKNTTIKSGKFIIGGR